MQKLTKRKKIKFNRKKPKEDPINEKRKKNNPKFKKKAIKKNKDQLLKNEKIIRNEIENIYKIKAYLETHPKHG